VAALSQHGDPIAKVTILPAGQALGVTEQLPVDERHLYSEGYLKDSLAIRLGGRAAELLGEHRDSLDRLTALLLERETVNGADVDEILARVPGPRLWEGPALRRLRSVPATSGFTGS
jgi:ATP-dependent Zn protease